MNDSSQPSPRRKVRKAAISAEALETRALLTGGAGNTFAIMQSTIATAGVKAVVPFIRNSTLITPPKKGGLTLGLDVAPQSTSKASPKIVGITDDATKRPARISRATYNPVVQRVDTSLGNETAAVLTTLKVNPKEATHNYSVAVQGSNATTGDILVGFFLPGDATGDGVVDAADITAIKKATNGIPGDDKYLFAADGNRDGRINRVDLKLAQKNLGARVTVNPVVSADLAAASDTGLADRVTSLRTVAFTGNATPGATISYDEASNKAPKQTVVAGADGKYGLTVNLGDGQNSFRVTSTDGFGQSITGLIAPVTFSATAPALNPSATAASVPPAANAAKK